MIKGEMKKMKKLIIKDSNKITMYKPSNSEIKKKVNELERSLGLNTKFKNVPAYLIVGGWLCVISSITPITIVGLVLASIALVLSFSKNYKNAYRWNKAITLYFINDIEKAKTLLDKLSLSEKEGEAYKEMLKKITHKYSDVTNT